MRFKVDPAQSFEKACEEGFTFDVIDPNGQPTGARITVRGPESAAVRQHQRRVLARLQKLDAEAKAAGRPMEMSSLDPDGALALDLAVAVTISWDGFDGPDDQPWPCTPENARTLYSGWAWVRDAVLEQSKRLGNFTRSGRPSSSSTAAPSSGST